MRWVAQAACAGCDPDLHTSGRAGNTEKALKVCASCPVRIECLEHALSRFEYGVWGGTTHHQRYGRRTMPWLEKEA